MTDARASRLATAVALAVALPSGIFAFAAAKSVIGSTAAAGLVGIAAAGLIGYVLARVRPIPVDTSATPRWLLVVSGLVSAAAILQLARLTVFMVDPTQVACSFWPSSVWEQQHSCLTAYHVAAGVASTGDIYDDALYSEPNTDPSAPRKPLTLGTFKIDVYEYPPPFLLLFAALHLVTPEFLDLRMLWFAISGGILLVALVATARLLGPVPGTRALLLAPFVFLAIPTMSTLQKGNVQAIIVAMSILAMILFERKRPIAGGALLAYAIACKLYPGLLVVYLMARRQWRAFAWTATWGAAFCLATLLLFGLPPYYAFLEHFPRLLSGEAFPAFRRPIGMAINLSIPGLLFKAKLFGMPGVTFDLARTFGSIYMLVALVVTLYAALSPRLAHLQPQLWIAVVIIATLRSPFLPPAYGTLPPVWLLTLLAAQAAPRARTLAPMAAAWILLSLFCPVDRPIDPRIVAAGSTVQLGVIVWLVYLALWSRPVYRTDHEEAEKR